jgi:hypothetical protein
MGGARPGAERPLRAAKRGGREEPVDPPGQSGVTVRGSGWPLGVRSWHGKNPAELGRPARRRSITGKFCFGAVPYTVPRHDCRGIIAVTAAGVHASG